VVYLFTPAAAISLLTVGVGVYETLLGQGAFPESFRHLPNTTIMLQLMISALSLLLVFR
jgi:hypothetical protein